MTERLPAHLRWVFAAIMVSFPLAALLETLRVSECLVVAVISLPWSLGALGLALGLRAARGFAIGVGLACALLRLLFFGWRAPDDILGAAMCAQALLVLLALPFFGAAFLDAPRVRFVAGTLGLATPLIIVHTMIVARNDGSSAWTMVTLGVLVIGALGLARQKTWSLLALLTGAALLALAPLLTPPAPFGQVCAGVVVIGVLAWVGPVFRALRSS